MALISFAFRPSSWSLALVGLLAACGGASKEQDEAALRAAAKPAVFQIVALEFPLAPPLPLVDCVVDNASDEERFILGQAQLQGIRGVDSNLVRSIISRAETRACLSGAGLRPGEYGW